MATFAALIVVMAVAVAGYLTGKHVEHHRDVIRFHMGNFFRK